MESMSFLAVDLGASGGKLSLGTFSDGRFTLTDVHRFDNGGVSVWTVDAAGNEVEKSYWDDLYLYSQIVEGLRKARTIAPGPVVSLGIDTWGADAALLNSHGESLGAVYCYRDHRLDNVREELFKRISPRELFDLSGIPSQPWYLINQLFWLTHHRPDLARLVHKVVPVPSQLQYYLCGNWAAEASWMAVQQLCTVGKAEYDARLVSACGIPASALPEIVLPGTIVGNLRPELVERTHLAGCRVVAVKTHDTASAYTAAAVAEPAASLVISSGTWSLVGKLLDEPLVNEAVFEHRLANEGIAGDVRLLRNVMGTWPVQQLRDAWSKADGKELTWDEVVRLASAGAALKTLIDVDDPAIFNPAGMEQALRDQIARTGQPQPAGRGELLRAVYEGLAIKVAQVNSLLERATAAKHKVVHIVGGGARNALLNQFIADATGLEVQAGPYEATSIGNILVQAAACGAVRSIDEGRQIVSASLPTQRFQPRDSSAWAAAGRKLEEMNSR